MKTWELDNNNQFPMGLLATNTDARELVASGAVFPYFVVLSNELYTPKILVCPKDEQRKPALDFARLADANISYFLNVDVTPDDRADVVLSGDGNLTNRLAPGQSFVSLTPKTQIGWDKGIHAENGHLLFCDGSVGGYSNGGMVVRISLVGTETNRLALPRRITSSLKQE